MRKYYIYNGQVYSADELQHWKYVKRYKSNGKWRYVYADKDTHLSIEDNKKLADRNEEKYNEYHEDSVRLQNLANERIRKGLTSDGSLEYSSRRQEERAMVYKENGDWFNNYADKVIDSNSVSTLTKEAADNAKEEATKAANAVSSTVKKTVKTASGIASSSVEKGKSLINNLLKKLKK